MEQDKEHFDNGCERYFDKAYPVGSAKNLSEAKGKLLNYINSKRK